MSLGDPRKSPKGGREGPGCGLVVSTPSNPMLLLKSSVIEKNDNYAEDEQFF